MSETDWYTEDKSLIVQLEEEIVRKDARIKELEEFVMAEGECHLSYEEFRNLKAENEALKQTLIKNSQWRVELANRVTELEETYERA